MSNTWACPFWQLEEKGTMYCEGARIRFKSPEARESYIARYCTAVPGWEDCPIAKMVAAEYEKGEQQDGQ